MCIPCSRVHFEREHHELFLGMISPVRALNIHIDNSVFRALSTSSPMTCIEQALCRRMRIAFMSPGVNYNDAEPSSATSATLSNWHWGLRRKGVVLVTDISSARCQLQVPRSVSRINQLQENSSVPQQISVTDLQNCLATDVGSHTHRGKFQTGLNYIKCTLDATILTGHPSKLSLVYRSALLQLWGIRMELS